MQARLGDRLYGDMDFQGKIDRTILAGRTIFDGEIVGRLGQGKLLRPS